MNVKELLEQHGIVPVRASGSKGGEYHSACPGCGGTDRFHVWPEQGGGDGSYWCRSCDQTGDNIQFLRVFSGLSFADACRKLGREDLLTKAGATAGTCRPGIPTLPTVPARPSTTPPSWTPSSYPLPGQAWRDAAESMTDHCHQALLQNQTALIYLEGRGIPMAAVIRHRLGWHAGADGKDHRFSSRKKWGLPEEISAGNQRPKPLWIPRGLVIPCICPDTGQVLRLRIRRPATDVVRFGKPYHLLPGSSMRTLIAGDLSARCHIIVEAELDAIACAAAAGDLVAACAVMTVCGKPDTLAAALLARSALILNALDIGDIGGGAEAASRARAWWRTHYAVSKLWPVPVGKDPGEAAQEGEDLRLWIKAGLPPVFRQPLSVPGQTVRALLPMVTPVGEGDKIGGQKMAAADLEEQPSAAKCQGDTDVAELAALLSTCPVTIRKTEDGNDVGIKWNSARRRVNEEQYGRISHLVFRSIACAAYIDRHPALVITAGNFTVQA